MSRIFYLTSNLIHRNSQKLYYRINYLYIIIKRNYLKTKKYCKDYIYELFRISQYKTGNEFRKSQQPEFSGEF